MQLTDEQVQKIIQGMDMVMDALGGPTVSQLIEQQKILVAGMPEEQQLMFTQTITKQTADLLASSIKMTTSEYKKNLDNALGGKK